MKSPPKRDYVGTEMPKRSRTDDRRFGMISSHAQKTDAQKTKTSIKSSETARKGTEKGKKGKNPLDIPLSDFSPEVREMLVAGMVKGGRARLVKRKESKPKK